MMLAIGVLLSQRIEAEPVLHTGWLDPFFIGFVAAIVAELFVLVWLLATDVDPKLDDDASSAPDTPPAPMPEAPAPSPPSAASTGVHGQEQGP